VQRPTVGGPLGIIVGMEVREPNGAELGSDVVGNVVGNPVGCEIDANVG